MADSARGKTSRGPVFENRIVCSDALKYLRKLPDGVVDCTVTSPPYFRQRDYASDAQIGRESDCTSYVSRLVEVFRECLRVTAATGTLWMVLGDKYTDGQQMGLPWQVALALKDVGWLLRSDIIWHKPNAAKCLKEIGGPSAQDHVAHQRKAHADASRRSVHGCDEWNCEVPQTSEEGVIGFFKC